MNANARVEIRNYLIGPNASLEAAADISSPDVAEVAEQDPHSLELAQKGVDLSAELDSMFPSEKEVAPGKVPLVQRSAEFFPPEAAAQAPSSRNRVPLEPAVGTLESDISPEAQLSPTQSDLRRHPASARPRPIVGVDQAQQVESSRAQFNPESESSGHGPKMPVPSFRHAPPNPSPSPSPNLSPNSSIDPEADRATHERLVAAFAGPANSPSAHPSARPQARPSSESPHVPADHPPITFSGFGYQPAEFEEPFGKKWVGVGAVLVALLAVGVVLAVGPSKCEGPDFPTSHNFRILGGPASSESAGKTNREAGCCPRMPTANEKPAQPAASPVACSVGRSRCAKFPKWFARHCRSGAPPRRPPSAKDSNEQYGGGDTADPEAEVLQFQREHSQARIDRNGELSRVQRTRSVPYPKPDVSASFVPRRDRCYAISH